MKTPKTIVSILIMLVVISLCTGSVCTAAGAPKKVIIDTDMGWDDTLSTLYLLKNPNIEIIGVTVTGCGETNLRWGKVIAKTLMEMGNKTKVPVCTGTSQPLKFDHRFPQSFRDDMNDLMGLAGSMNPEIEIELDPRPAWQFLSETLNQTDEKITILALGGFTNLAKMLELYPDTKTGNIQEVYAMAGAVFVDGNVALLNNAKPEWNQGPIYSTNHYAEWNVFVDPLAAKRVVASKIPLTIIPLDACDYVMLSKDDIDTIKGNDNIAALAKAILIHKTGSHSEGIPVPIFDPLATMIMAHGLQNYEFSEAFLDVSIDETEKNNQCGRLVVKSNGTKKVKIIQGVSSYQFKKNFAAILNR